MMSDLSEYVDLANIEQGFPGEPALKKGYKTLMLTSTSYSATTKKLSRMDIL